MTKSYYEINPAIHHLMDVLSNLIRGGFENPEGISGKVQLDVSIAESAYPISICFTPTDLDIRPEWVDQPDAILYLPLQTVELIVESTTEIDFRDPEVMGTVTFSGNLAFINHVAKSLLRPTPDTKERFETAEHLDTSAYGLTKVSRISDPTEFEILESIAAGRPMIITNPGSSTQAASWSLNRLEAIFGDVLLRVRSAEQKETVSEFIARLRSTDVEGEEIIEGHTKAYTEGCFLPEAMHQDFVPSYFSTDDYIEPQIWLGSVPTDVPASSLHHDPLDGFLYQIMGRKKLIMYPPDQAFYLYPMKAYNNYQPCWVKPELPNYEVFPEFAKARPVEIVLNPGELLVQPAGWFHAVYCLDSPTFSVSYFLRH